MFYINNKLIKRKAFLNALIFMGNEIINELLFYNEDIYQLFCLLRVANSFFSINEGGYFKLSRIKNQTSLFQTDNINQVLHDHFTIVKSLFYKTKNTKHDKIICFYFLINNKFIF